MKKQKIQEESDDKDDKKKKQDFDDDLNVTIDASRKQRGLG